MIHFTLRITMILFIILMKCDFSDVYSNRSCLKSGNSFVFSLFDSFLKKVTNQNNLVEHLCLWRDVRLKMKSSWDFRIGLRRYTSNT